MIFDNSTNSVKALKEGG